MTTGPTLSLMLGTARDYQLQAQPLDPVLPPYSDSNPSPFLSSDALATVAWAGADQASLLAPATAWLDALAATFQVSFNDADTAGLAAGNYRIRTTATRGGRSAVLLDGRLALASSPGATTAPLAFTSLPDLLLYCPWLADLQDDPDLAGFAAEQARATSRLVDSLVNQWKPDRVWPAPGNSGQVVQWGAGLGSSPPAWWLRQQVMPLVPGSTAPAAWKDRISTQANFVDPRVSTALLLYDEVKEIAAKWAIAYVLRAQVNADPKLGYERLAARYAREASSLYRVRKFEMDLGVPQTGYSWFSIHGGGASLR